MNLNLEVSTKNLDTAWQGLPEEVKVWGCALADAVKEQQEAETQLKLISAKKEIAIRKNPSDFGFAKVTEDLVTALVLDAKEVQDAMARVATAKNNVNVTKAIVEALDVKRSSLKYLSELMLIGYLGSTSPSLQIGATL